MNIGTVGRVTTPVKARRYDSPVRARRAERTRRAVLRAAHDLFTTRGYAATSVADVARRAKVSVDTVYAAVGTKPELLIAVHDMVLGSADQPVPAEQREYVRRVREAPTAQEKVDVYADALARVLPRTVPLVLALREAGRTEAGCRSAAEALDERRAGNMLLFAADLRATGQVRADLTDDEVAHLVWSMNSPDWFAVFTSRGRTPEDYARTVADVWRRTLLG